MDVRIDGKGKKKVRGRVRRMKKRKRRKCKKTNGEIYADSVKRKSDE